MAPDQHFITIKGNRRELGLFVFPQPRMEPFPQRQIVGRHKCALLLVPERLCELIGYLLTGLPVERGTSGLPGCSFMSYGHLRHPAPIWTPGNGPPGASISRRW